MVCRHLILPPLKTNDGSKIQVRRRHILNGIPTQRIPTSSLIEVSYELLRYYKDQQVHSRTQIGTLTSLIVSEPHTQTLLHAQPPKVDGNTPISNRYQSLSFFTFFYCQFLSFLPKRYQWASRKKRISQPWYKKAYVDHYLSCHRFGQEPPH